MNNVIQIQAPEKSTREAKLLRDMEDLISVFQELRKLEEITGRTGIAAMVQVSITGILANADRIARIELKEQDKKEKVGK